MQLFLILIQTKKWWVDEDYLENLIFKIIVNFKSQ